MAIERLTDAYRLGSPEGCLVAHLLHARELDRAGSSSERVLHHRLAAGLIASRIEWDQLDAVVAEIRGSVHPEQPPTFADVVETLEVADGLAFRALLDTLPGRGRDGDQALAELWQRVTARRPNTLDGPASKAHEIPPEFWETLPPAVRHALTLEGDAMEAALQRALRQLPEAEARATLSLLQEVGILGGMSEDGRGGLVEGFQTFLNGVVSVAMGDDGPREDLELLLPELDRAGWHIMVPVFQIWEGRRDEEGLCAGLDSGSARLVKHILALIREAESGENPADYPGNASRQGVETGDREPQNSVEPIPNPAVRLVDISDPAALTPEQRALVDTMPPLLRDVFTLDDPDFGEALGTVLGTMPPDEGMIWMKTLFDTGLVGAGDDLTTEDALENLDPFLFDLAQVAKGRNELRPYLENYLHALDKIGMHITDAVFRMWAGERDPASLTSGLDPSDALIVNRILEHLNREIV